MRFSFPLILVAVSTSPAFATVQLTKLATFGTGQNSSFVDPNSSFIIDGSGNLYGISAYGQANTYGVFYELPSEGNTLIALGEFNGTNGDAPTGKLAIDGNGNIYGVTQLGGPDWSTESGGSPGTVFEVARGSDTITTVAAFDQTNGAYPVGGITIDSAGNLYGTASGTVFEVPSGTNVIDTLATFKNTDEMFPVGGVVLDNQGNIYGVTSEGGSATFGAIYEVAKGSNTVTTLTSFATESAGWFPQSGVIMDNNGDLFGITSQGGANNEGTIYELSKGSTSITPLASFSSSSGGGSSLIMDADGNLFGTTPKGGVDDQGSIFELPVGSNTIETVASFEGQGSDPDVLVSDQNGNLYGATATPLGTIFEVTGSGFVVPEPNSIGLIFAVAICACSRRRKRSAELSAA